MKQAEMCCGRRGSTAQVHQMVSLRRIPKGRLRDYLMGVHSFDRVTSTKMDSPADDGRKSHK